MAPVTERDWYTWHHDYDDPGSALARRLAAVQDQIRVALDQAEPGLLRAISVCAGQGRDLIGALAGHPRGVNELWVSDSAEGWGAAAHRFTGTPDPLQPGVRMFTFRGHHPRTGPDRDLPLFSERIVVHAAAPVSPVSPGSAGPGACWGRAADGATRPGRFVRTGSK
jgi:hypothetical protein